MRNSLIVAALFVMVGCGVEATDPSQSGDPTTTQDAINFDTVPTVVGGPYEYGVPGAVHGIFKGAEVPQPATLERGTAPGPGVVQ